MRTFKTTTNSNHFCNKALPVFAQALPVLNLAMEKAESIKKLGRNPATDKLVEKFELPISYEECADDNERFETDIDKLKAALKRLRRLPPKCQYRVLVNTEDDAPDLPGWASTQARDDSHLKKQDIGKVIDTAAIGVAMAYLGTEGSDDQCK